MKSISFIVAIFTLFSKPFTADSFSCLMKRMAKVERRVRTVSRSRFNMLTVDNDSDLASGEAWEHSVYVLSDSNISNLMKNAQKLGQDPLWEQIKLEAQSALAPEPEAGPQIYQAILSQPSLLHALTKVICNDVETPSMPATALRNLFFQMLTSEDDWNIHADVMAVTMRSSSVGNAMMAVLFNTGLHALVCHRLSHRLWLQGRTGLAYYIQSTVSSKYSADIHPASKIGGGIYLNAGAGVVIGETAVIGDDVSILQGVTLGGTGKERGDRHPKVGNRVILQDGSTVLGNIKVGDGSIITSKSIVTKPVPPLAIVSGIPAKIKSYREEVTKPLESDGQ